MPLIECPDCGKQISDAAPACIGCGRPNTPIVETQQPDAVPVDSSGSHDPQKALFEDEVGRLRSVFARKDSAELIRIWVDNDRNQHSDEAFEAIRLELDSRNIDSLKQMSPTERAKQGESDGFFSFGTLSSRLIVSVVLLYLFLLFWTRILRSPEPPLPPVIEFVDQDSVQRHKAQTLLEQARSALDNEDFWAVVQTANQLSASYANRTETKEARLLADSARQMLAAKSTTTKQDPVASMKRPTCRHKPSCFLNTAPAGKVGRYLGVGPTVMAQLRPGLFDRDPVGTVREVFLSYETRDPSVCRAALAAGVAYAIERGTEGRWLVDISCITSAATVNLDFDSSRADGRQWGGSRDLWRNSWQLE